MTFDCPYIVVSMTGCETVVWEHENFNDALRYSMSETYGPCRIYKLVDVEEKKG
jgi:hypothetical protein